MWDGSQPGWTLQHFDRIEWAVTFNFASTGPSAREVSSLRTLLDAFRDLPMSDVLAQLRGLQTYTTPEPLGNLEMRWIVDRANRIGLDTTPSPTDRSGYLSVFSDCSAMIIEDDDLAAQVTQRMLDAGVPVQHIHVD